MNIIQTWFVFNYLFHLLIKRENYGDKPTNIYTGRVNNDRLTVLHKPNVKFERLK